MLTRTLSAAVAALIVGSIGLAGCSTSSNATVTHTPALQTTGGRDTARSGTQVAIMLANTTNGIALPGGPAPAGIARLVLGMRQPSVAGAASGACSNSTKQSTSGSTTTKDWFYDAACTTLETEEVITMDSSGLSGTGTIKTYDRSGNLRVAQTLTITVTSTAATSTAAASRTVTVSSAASATVGGTTTGQYGATCMGDPSSSAVNCSAAHTGTSGGVGFGEAIATTGTAGSGSTATSAGVTVSFVLGASLGISQSSNTWGVTGNSAFNSATGTWTFNSTSSKTGAATLSLKDALYTYTETANYGADGTLSVTIVENPNGIVTVDTPIATASVDAGGVGTINYADGTSEPIAGWLVGY